MVLIDPIRKNLLRSKTLNRPFHNATTAKCYDYMNDTEIPCDPTKCYDPYTGYEVNCEPVAKSPFDWKKLGLNLSNAFDTLGVLFGGLSGNATAGMTPAQLAAYQAQQAQLKSRKVLGMEAVTGTVVLFAGLAVVGYLGYKFIKKAMPAAK